MSERTLCPTCRRPIVVCYCAHVSRIETRTRVLFLQHPRERDVPVNTVRIARLCLPNSDVRVGVEFENDPVVRAALNDPARPAVLLYPGPTSVDLREAAPTGPVTLIMLDGTWPQAEKLLKRNPALHALPQYRLTPARPSTYRIRREPAEHCVATIEALTEVLGVLEGDPARAAPLLAPFNAMVEMQLDYAKRLHGGRSRHARAPRPPRPRPVPAILRKPSDDVVLVYGEANAWPFDAPDAPAPEIVHWVARRLRSGETFEAVIAPRRVLAPSVEYHVGLSRERITSGLEFAAFQRAWAAFLRPNDVLCTWGTYAADVLHADGVALPPRVDLKHAATLYLGARTGAIETCAATLGAVPEGPVCPGRAGRRMSSLSAIAQTLAARAAAE